MFWRGPLQFRLAGELDPILECAPAATSVTLAENLLVEIHSEARPFRACGHTLRHEG